MRSSLFTRLTTLGLLSVLSLVGYTLSTFGLTYPIGAPSGETVGGTYRTYFDNMFPGCVTVGDVIRGFTSTGVPICITPATTGLNMFGQTGFTLYYNGTVWTGSANIYNNNGNVGIGMTPSTTSGKLQIGGQIMITGGTPGLGKFLVSDATGLASWQSTTTSLSGTYWSLSGNIAGVNDFLGTVNNQNLVFKRNNVTVARFMTGSNIAFGENALFSNTTGVQNIAIGTGALFSNTSGFNNIAIGLMSLYSNTTGNSNTANGMMALFGNTTGNNNTAFGASALMVNTTGFQNTAIGTMTLTSNSSGNNNTANGALALYSNTTGYSNTAIGQGSLYANTTGYGNTANGLSSLGLNTTGYNNTAMGQGSLTFNTIGANNTAIGSNALVYNISGSGNVAVGTEALFASTGGTSFQTAVGYQALRNSTTGVGNTAFGNQALFSNTTASYNTAIGSGALRNNTIGSSNTANGMEALLSNTSGFGNIANGVRSLRYNTTGWHNVAIGFLALEDNTIGQQNIAIGQSALANNTTGSQNTAIGQSALISNTTGLYNTANGGLSLGNNSIGSGNVAMGYESLFTATGVSFQTAVGYQALRNSTTGTQNLAIGYQAGSGITTGSNNIAIGYNAQVPSGTASNQLNIGNWIYGNGGNIGIGTSAPAHKLHVVGNTYTSGSFYAPSIDMFAMNGSLVNKVIPANTNQVIQSPIAGFLWHDLFPFNKTATPTFQTSIDGTTWSTGTLNSNLFAQKEYQSISVVSSPNIAARWTWNSANFSWSYGKWLVLGITYSTPTQNITVTFESSTDGVTWTPRHTSTYTDNSKPIWHAISGYNGDSWLRLTIRNNTNTASVNLSSIRLLSDRWGDQGRGSELSYPYTWDANQNMFMTGVGVGVSALTSAARLEVAGQIKITGGSPGVGYILTSDATGLASWQPASASSNSWLLTGNAGTSPGTNFLGTTDAQDLVFRTNNIEQLRITASGNILGINSFVGTANNSFIWGSIAGIGVGGSYNLLLGGSFAGNAPLAQSLTGSYNTAIGGISAGAWMSGQNNLSLGGFRSGYQSVGNVNTTVGGYYVGQSANGSYNSYLGGSYAGSGSNGFYNVTLGGSGAGRSMSGFNNVAIGGLRGGFQMNGNYNTTIGGLDGGESMIGAYNLALGGREVGAFMLGNYNSAIGGFAAGTNMGGMYNVAIGSSAGGSMSGSNNVYIGSQAIGNTNQDNQFSLGNVIYGSGMGLMGLTNGRVGIGTMTPGQKLTISGGTIQIINGSQGSGRVLTSDASGIASWQSVPASPNSWNITGNSGTIAGTNFLGTTDNQDLVLKTNSGEKMRILSNRTSSGIIAYMNGGDTVINGITVGMGSGQEITNTAIGKDALLSNVPFMGLVGSWNTAVGYQALRLNTSGQGNTTIGMFSLTSNTQGIYNTANGFSALRYNTTGDFNTANGVSALEFNTAGSYNAAFGIRALESNNGTGNVAMGFESLNRANGVSYQTAVGYQALRNSTTGYGNSAFGNQALFSNTTGYNNVAVGSGALRSNTTGNSNTANGASALMSNTTGGSNTANGYLTLYANTTGVGNTSNGAAALASNTTGRFNTANGISTLYSNTTGGFNTADGISALYSNTTGHYNTANGAYALQLNTIGSGNVAIGTDALRSSTTISFQTAVGYQALSNATTGTQNLAIGYQAGSVITTGSNNIAIGYNAQVPSGTASNQLNIGNWIYGNAGNIGIGTSTGTARLTVAGSGLITGDLTVQGKVITDTIVNRTVANVTISGSLLPDAAAPLIYRDIGNNTTQSWNNLYLSGQVTIKGGTPGVNRVLTSDANGLASWQPVPTSTNNWSTTGNAGTIAGTNFLGTTDDQDLVLKRNNVTVARFMIGSNLALGSSALSGNTSGVNNTAIGQGALFSNTIGDANVANGNFALSSNTAGSLNTALGFSALDSNTIGNRNTAIGSFSLASNINGSGNIAIGDETLVTTTSVSFQTAVGYQALRNSTTGTQNLAIGYQAGSGITTGSNNIAIGYNAQVPSGTASNQLNIGNWIYGNGGNIGIGTSAPGQRLTISGGTVQIINGTQALGRILVSDANGIASWQNGFSGTTTASGITGGTQNYIPKFGTSGNGLVLSRIYDNGTYVAVGSITPQSTFEIWSGATNYMNMRGTNNLGIGAGSVRIGVTGSANTGYGNESLFTLTSGYSNSAFGHQALRQSTAGFNNSAFGKEAMYNDGDGTWNTAMGYLALRQGTSSDYNVAIGGGALFTLGTGSGNVAVGANSLYNLAATASNNTALGYLAGSGITSGWNNIAIGFNAQVPSGTASNQLNIGNWIYGSGGNIGIGTGASAALTSRLNVDGGTANVSGLRLNRLSSTSPAFTGNVIGLGVDANGNVVPVSNGDVVVYDGIDRASPPTPNPDIPNRQIAYDFNRYFAIPTKQSFVVSDGSSPSNNGPFFRENGTSSVCSWNGTFGSSPYNCNGNDTYGVAASPYNSFTMTAKGTTFGYQIALGARGDAPLFARSGRFNGDPENGLYTNDSPFTTPAPWQKVITVPANHVEYFYINTGFNSQLQGIANGGRIGIGTTNPQYGLDIRSTVGINGQLNLSGANTTAATPTIRFIGDENTGIFRPAADTLSVSTNGTERMRIFSNGNVSIGGTTSSDRLRVDGTVKLGSNGTTMNALIRATVSQDVPSIAAGSCSARIFSVPNSLTTGTAFISPASALTDRMVISYARVYTAGTVEAKFCNVSAAPIDLPSMNYYITVMQ